MNLSQKIVKPFSTCFENFIRMKIGKTNFFRSKERTNRFEELLFLFFLELALLHKIRRKGVRYLEESSFKTQYLQKYKIEKIAKMWLLYLERSVTDQMKNDTVEWRFTLSSHFLTTPTPGKERGDVKRYCVLIWILRFDLNIAFWCNVDIFIDFKCGSQCNIAYLRLVIMKKT